MTGEDEANRLRTHDTEERDAAQPIEEGVQAMTIEENKHEANAENGVNGGPAVTT